MTRANAFAAIFRRAFHFMHFAYSVDGPRAMTVSLIDDGAAWSMRVNGRVFSGRHKYESSAGEGATERD